MSSTTASGALSILNNYGGNSSLVNAMVKSQELNQEQTAEIASLRKQLASLSGSTATTGTTNATGTTGTQAAVAAMQQLMNYPGSFNGMNAYGNQFGPGVQTGISGYPMMGGMMGNRMASAQNGLNSVSTLLNSGSPVSASTLQQSLQQSAQALQLRLGEICKTTGVDVNQDVTLNLDSAGQIVVTGDTSDKEKLQTALRADSAFTRLFSDTKLLRDYMSKISTSSTAA